MSNETKTSTGAIGWTDLTIDDAGGLRDFYSAVVSLFQPA